MRACLLLCAALALAPSRPRAAAPPRPPPHAAHPAHPAHPAHQPARLEHIKTQILAKLGLSSRPTPLGAPPRDVVRQILARAADPLPERRPEPEHSMREIIAIAHRGDELVDAVNNDMFKDNEKVDIENRDLDIFRLKHLAKMVVTPEPEHSMREIIAISHRSDELVDAVSNDTFNDTEKVVIENRDLDVIRLKHLAEMVFTNITVVEDAKDNKLMLVGRNNK